MKKYRITKILVKTREIVSMSKNTVDEIHVSACPTCHSLIPTSSLPCPESSAGGTNAILPPTELPTAGACETETSK